MRFDERIPAFIPSDVGIGVDVSPHTLAEFRRALAEGWGVARIALAEGMVLFQREGELKELLMGPAGADNRRWTTDR